MFWLGTCKCELRFGKTCTALGCQANGKGEWRKRRTPSTDLRHSKLTTHSLKSDGHPLRCESMGRDSTKCIGDGGDGQERRLDNLLNNGKGPLLPFSRSQHNGRDTLGLGLQETALLDGNEPGKQSADVRNEHRRLTRCPSLRHQDDHEPRLRTLTTTTMTRLTTAQRKSTTTSWSYHETYGRWRSSSTYYFSKSRHVSSQSGWNYSKYCNFLQRNHGRCFVPSVICEFICLC